MSKLLNAVKEFFVKLKHNTMMRTILICVLALLLIFSVTLAWYINNLGLWGMEFSTGNIDFNAYVYDNTGKRLIGPISPDDEDRGTYINAPLFSIDNAQVGSTGTVYFAIESTGSIGIQYRIAFDVTGKDESANAYLGGYKYKVTKVTDKVALAAANDINVSGCPSPDKIDDEIITIDRNAINGTIEQDHGYDVYRFDYTLANNNKEYTGNTINFYMNIFATQVGGDFEDTAERGYIYYCSTREDIDRAKVEAYPGDIIRLSSNIVYYGDLVFNKPIHLETNDFTLTVNGNLMYEYVLGNDLKIDSGGLGQVIVQCTKEGVGGNFKIKTPLSNVTLIGSNATTGDFIVEKTVTVDATNSYGAAGVSFNNARIVDEKNSRKTILLESNTRATVSFGTTIGLLQTVVKANNIEIVNNGVIGDINLSNMGLLEQTNSPQIYILNNNDINNPISLPEWSVKFVQSENGKCTGNTRIIQSHSGSPMTVSGICVFDNDDIEVETNDTLVKQIISGNDSRLRIYYQDMDGEVTTIQSILENYLQNEATTGCTLNEVLQLEIISIGTKSITNADIAFMNSSSMLSLQHLDMQRAHMYDTTTATYNKLPNNAFTGVSKYATLVLPQDLTEIGNLALSDSKIQNPVTVPAGVTVFGNNWFRNGMYVRFAASVPDAAALGGLVGVKAIFVDEAYIQSYKSVYSAYETRIYPVSVLDESKEHFVRNLRNNDWEITYYIHGDDAVIGSNITMDGEILKITSVYDNAYRHNFTLNEVKFADSVEHLGAFNFYTNNNVAYVDLNNIKTIGESAFAYCINLSELVVGDRLEEIGNGVFQKCTGLNQDIILPDTMKFIGNSAFRDTPITGIDAGGTTTIYSFAFNACKQLVYADFSNVIEVGADGTNRMLTGCSKLVWVDFSSLEKANGERMLGDCTSLRQIYMGSTADTVSLSALALAGTNTKNVRMFVPEEHLAFYQTQLNATLSASNMYPKGELMGELLVNGFNIGQYIVLNNGDNTYALVVSNLEHSGTYTIPAKFENNPITKIYANAFRNQSFTDVKLNIGNNVKEIGNYAFYGLNGLVQVDFGKSLEILGTYAFANCGGIEQDVVLPASMRSIGAYAFTKTPITSVKTGGALSVADRAFQNCASLIYAELPEVTSISADGGTNEVFASCASLVSVKMPKVGEVYGNRMFLNCTSLREIVMGSKNPNVSLGALAFGSMNTTKIKLFVPEDEVAFYVGRSFINSYQIFPIGEKLGDESVNGFVIGDYIMLRNDTGYTLVTSNLSFTDKVDLPTEYNGLPVTKIGDHAFRNVTFTKANLVLGDDVTTIGTGAFYLSAGLSAITMDGVETIETEAFYASGLKVLNGPAVTTIGDRAFASCVSMTVANLPAMVNLNGAYCLSACTGLKTIYFANIMTVNANALQGTNKLENITINRLIDEGGSNLPALMKIDSSAPCKIYVPYRSLSAYSNPWSGKPVVTFDTTVKHNGDTYILTEGNDGKFAVIDFMPGSSSTSLTLPATVTVDGASVGITGIREGAFSTVNGTLKKITLSANIAQLYPGALNECGVLEEIAVDSGNSSFTSLNGVLYSKDSKMLVKYPIGRSGAFDMSATAYASTVSIGSTAFANATKLTQIVFPASLAVIDSSAFENCSGLHTVEFKGTTPPVLLGSNIFNTGVEGFKMVVPTASNVVTAYLSSYNFREYEAFINQD